VINILRLTYIYLTTPYFHTTPVLGVLENNHSTHNSEIHNRNHIESDATPDKSEEKYQVLAKWVNLMHSGLLCLKGPFVLRLQASGR